MPIAPGLCHSSPSTIRVKGRPQWPAITPSVPVAAISASSTSSAAEGNRKRLISLAPPCSTARRRPPSVTSIRRGRAAIQARWAGVTSRFA
jgi:hypothetical protein